MTENKYRVHDFVKFSYSEIKEYIGEGYTDKPLRNDEIVNLLNEQEETIKNLKETIIKITLAYHEKYNDTIMNLINNDGDKYD